MRFAERQVLIGNKLKVRWSDGTVESYDAVDLTLERFCMDSHAFYRKYRFNFNPHYYPRLYEKCSEALFLEERKRYLNT